MRDIFLILVHLLADLSRLLRPGAVKALMAENGLLRHQLLILRRSRQRCPNLRTRDRILFGLGSLFMRPRRLARAALVPRSSTLLRCHRALTDWKCLAIA